MAWLDQDQLRPREVLRRFCRVASASKRSLPRRFPAPLLAPSVSACCTPTPQEGRNGGLRPSLELVRQVSADLVTVPPHFRSTPQAEPFGPCSMRYSWETSRGRVHLGPECSVRDPPCLPRRHAETAGTDRLRPPDPRAIPCPLSCPCPERRASETWAESDRAIRHLPCGPETPRKRLLRPSVVRARHGRDAELGWQRRKRPHEAFVRPRSGDPKTSTHASSGEGAVRYLGARSTGF